MMLNSPLGEVQRFSDRHVARPACDAGEHFLFATSESRGVRKRRTLRASRRRATALRSRTGKRPRGGAPAEALKGGHRLTPNTIIAGQRRKRRLVRRLELAPGIDRSAPIAGELALHRLWRERRWVDGRPAPPLPQSELTRRPSELLSPRGRACRRDLSERVAAIAAYCFRISGRSTLNMLGVAGAVGVAVGVLVGAGVLVTAPARKPPSRL